MFDLDHKRPFLHCLHRAPGLVLTFSIVLAFHGAYLAFAGIALAPDTGTYSTWADSILTRGIRDFLTSAESPYPPAMYIGWLLVVATAKLCAGVHWTTFIAVAGLLADCCMGAAVVRLSRRIGGSAVSWIILVLYLICYEAVKWAHTILSDEIFTSALFLVFAIAADSILQGTRRSTLWLCSGTAFVVVFRPNGMAVLPLVAAAAFVMCHTDMSRERTRVVIRRTAAYCAALLALCVVANALLMLHPQWWPFDFYRSSIGYNADMYRAGAVVYGRENFNVAASDTVLGYINVTIHRVLYFFHFWRSSSGRVGTLFNLVSLPPLYVLSIAGAAATLLSKDISANRRWVGMLALLFVSYYTVFTAIVQLDFDWRYRLPVIPFLFVLAAAGMRSVLRVIIPRLEGS